MSVVKLNISAEDYHLLSMAYEALEHPSFAARLSSLIGLPLEQALKLMPRRWQAGLHRAAEAAVARATEVAISSLGEGDAGRPARSRLHQVLAMGAGAAGGALGLPGLVAELPVTTVLMLRAIADIARSHGEDLSTPEARMACMAVFAFGGRTHDDDYAEIGYYEVRAALALHFTSAVERAMAGGGPAKGVPAVVDVVRLIAGRFGVRVSDKAAAQFVPVVGAGAGALVNAVFMQHFQSVAQGHFTLRALERDYGRDAIESAYRAMADSEGITRYSVKPRPRRARRRAGT
ncbi:MAG: EcsC family protein [Hyphomicrobiales bacterium]|nr:EcsC family protein [Hyphomicrobiales bacterium]